MFAAFLNKKIFFTLAVFIFATLFISFYYTAFAQPNASVSLTKGRGGLFVLVITDPQGIKNFSLAPPAKLPYGGSLAGCPKNFESKNVLFANPNDFSPAMVGEIIDCQGNITQLDIAPPSDGKAVGVITNLPDPDLASAAALETEGGQSGALAPAPPISRPIKTRAEEPKTLPNTITYPVERLGNCKDETACKFYCDDADHMPECVEFAKKHGLISSKEAQRAEKFLAIGEGPGACNSPKSCETYCGSITHIDECLAFAEKIGFLEGNELEEAQKINSYIKGGGTLPGGCTDRNTCEVYCSSGDNIDTCLAFAESADIMPPEELEQAKKFAKFMKKGETPGGCRGREQCEAYCADGAHFKECVDFALKAGIVPPEEAEIMRKTGGVGPGGCKGRQQCEAYCETHQEECFSWAQKHGVLHEKDLERMRGGAEKFKQELENMPPEMLQCLRNAVGADVLVKIEAGEPVFSRELGEKMRACAREFEEKIREQFGGGSGGFDPSGEPGHEREGGFPGGCSTPEECFEFCRLNPKECGGFNHPGDSKQPEEFPAGELPEGFKSLEGEFGEKFERQFEEQKAEEFQKRFQEEAKKFREQFEGQIQQPPEGFEGQIPPEFQQQIDQFQQQFQPPPEGFEREIPPEFQQEPTSITNPVYLLAAPLLWILGY